MKKIFSTTALVFLTGAVLFGCQAHRPGLIDPSFQAMDLNSKLQAGEYEQKIDNFYVRNNGTFLHRNLYFWGFNFSNNVWR